MLIEALVASPRHIEMQVFADAHGNCVHLFERDCSLQRRHQKVIEEARAGLPEETRAAMAKAATDAALASGYQGAGTVEFIADASRGLGADAFFFLEMNTRLQVEHPVTEAVTGLDLVEWQFRVAAGEPLPLRQERDHPLAARRSRRASTPRIPSTVSCPRRAGFWRSSLGDGASGGVRIDTGVAAGDEVTPFYDAMIAKVIAHAPTRTQALAALDGALDARRRHRAEDQSRLPRARSCAPGSRGRRRSTPASSTPISRASARRRSRRDGRAVLAAARRLIEGREGERPRRLSPFDPVGRQ